MFEHLVTHRKILVTGPHRSGTTFAATAIQHDLRETHGLVKEELCWLPDFKLDRFWPWFTEIRASVVVQAPWAADICHTVPAFIVFMVRNAEDIQASQRRMKLKDGSKVGWTKIEQSEFDKYHHYDVPIAEVKYHSWQTQKKHCLNMELEYESLRSHPLWIDRPFRKDFHVRQVSAVG